MNSERKKTESKWVAHLGKRCLVAFGSHLQTAVPTGQSFYPWAGGKHFAIEKYSAGAESQQTLDNRVIINI